MNRRHRTDLADLEFLPPGAEVRDGPPSRLGMLLGLVIVLVFVGASLWAWVGTVDVIAIARGRLIPRDRTQVVQAVDPGVIRRIHVRDGAAVRKGQALLELDPTTSDAEGTRLEHELLDARLNAARLEALLSGESTLSPPPSAPPEAATLQRRLLEDQRAEHRRRLAAAGLASEQRSAAVAATVANVERLETVVAIQTQRADAFRALLDRQFVATLQFLEVEERRVDKVQELAIERRRLEQEHAALAEAIARREVIDAEFRSARLAELASWEARAGSLAQELVKATHRRAVQRLSAPADGVVQQLAVHTIGGVVAAGQQLMMIVPLAGGLEVEAWVDNKDAGFVRVGQPAALKIETFPFTRYGTVPGSVVSVSADAMTVERVGLVYLARIALDRDAMEVDGEMIKLAPGMSVTAEIQIGRRRVIEYFLSPLLRRSYEALRER
jgi:membrane fusion protein, hemolysin D